MTSVGMLFFHMTRVVKNKRDIDIALLKNCVYFCSVIRCHVDGIRKILEAERHKIETLVMVAHVARVSLFKDL